MTYTEILPSENFKEPIHTYWKFEIPAGYNNGIPFPFEILPENTLSIVFINHPHFKGVTCLGVQAKRMKWEIYPGSVYLGIRFNPWVNIEGLFDDKLTSSNQIMKLATNLNEFFPEINPCDIPSDFSDYDLVERGLKRLLKHFKVTTDPLVKYICLQLESGSKINDFLEDIPLSIRPVQKRFKKITGTTMAEFRNISRLRNTVMQIYTQQKNITTAAFENGYTDHSHFMNTFKKLMLGSSLKSFLTQSEAISYPVPK